MSSLQCISCTPRKSDLLSSDQRHRWCQPCNHILLANGCSYAWKKAPQTVHAGTLVVEDLCLHVGFCNIQDPGRGIRGEQSKFPSCSLTDFINIFFDFLGFLKVCGSYLAELCKNPKQPVDINSGPAKNLYDDKTSIVSSS